MAWQTVLYIIESPKPQDLLEDRREGQSLMMALKLTSINAVYLQVSDFDTYEQAWDIIAADYLAKWKNNPKEVGAVFHFSAHGNQNCFGLTSGEQVDWDKLGLDLATIKDKVQRETGCDFVPIVCMSTCEGLFATQMAASLVEIPFYMIVGPKTKVDWADSLTAWIVFYHLFEYKEKTADVAAKIMNMAAGVEEGTFVGFTDVMLKKIRESV